MVVGAYNPGYSGGWGMRTAWTQEAEAAVSQDHTIALQPGQQEWNSISKNKTKQKQNHERKRDGMAVRQKIKVACRNEEIN